MNLLTALQHRAYVQAMSPLIAPARMFQHPLRGYASLSAGAMTLATTTTTTTTITTRSGWSCVRE